MTTSSTSDPTPGAGRHATDGPAAVRAQSLAHGAAGMALLHSERAHRGQETWQHVHTVLAPCVRELVADQGASLYAGAPAVAFALHIASGHTDRYRTALHTLDVRIAQLTAGRIAAAHARIDSGQRPHPSEFDLFYGLTGLGAYFHCRDAHHPVLREVLSYLVRLTLPLDGDAEHLPGWWTEMAPTGCHSPEFPDGHGNLGMAHGIAGVLSLLAITARHGCVVDGQMHAIRRICGWLDEWRQDTGDGPWWPQWITLTEHRIRTTNQPGPLRPSWCYGTSGLVRAQQLAALALGDTARQQAAERALLSCLADPAQLARIRDGGICHGAAGLLHTTYRVAQDAAVTDFASHLPRLRTLLADHAPHPGSGNGFLDGGSGHALAELTASGHGTVASDWDACLLSGLPRSATDSQPDRTAET